MSPDSLIQLCEWDAAKYFIVSDNVFSNLIYYSHLLPLVASFALGFFLIANNWKSPAVRALFVSILLLGVWLFFDLILWATEKPEYTLFFWSIVNMVEPIIYAGLLLFIYYFIDNRPPNFWQLLVIVAVLLPTVILTPTHYALEGFDLTNCDREAVEGIMVYYGYIVEIFLTGWILLFGILRIFNKGYKKERGKIALITFASLFLLLSFATGNVIGSWFVDWTIGQYGLFGIPVFVGLLGYLIVKFGAFNIRLIGAQVLVASLFILVTGLLFIRTIEVVRIVTSVTLIFVLILGILLIRGVYREIEQRKHIEKLAKELEESNQRQVVLIHFITHQIKGFVSKSRNIFAMMLDGDYGAIPESLRAIAQEGLRSDTQGVETIQDILNASNIKSGKVTYDMQPFDLKALIDQIANTLRPNAESKGLSLNLNTGDAPVTFAGDHAQLQNAFKNLVDNSIKYTPSGSVDVSLARSAGKLRFEIKDTGVGITPEDMKYLFTEGGHGKESTKVNVESTGFGLYIVKSIIEAHKGKVWAESEGAGKGSRFIVELPAV